MSLSTFLSNCDFGAARYKKPEDRVAYNTAMATLLPLLYSRIHQITNDQSELSVALQHHILKIFFATMQVSLGGLT